MILTLVNNWNDYGGRAKYVQWAKDAGVQINNTDEFFTNSVTKDYYKNHVKVTFYFYIYLSIYLYYCVPAYMNFVYYYFISVLH